MSVDICSSNLKNVGSNLNYKSKYVRINDSLKNYLGSNCLLIWHYHKPKLLNILIDTSIK